MSDFNRKKLLQTQEAQKQAYHFNFDNPIYLKRLNNEFTRFEINAFAGQVQKIDVEILPCGITWFIKIKPAFKLYKGLLYTVSLNFPEKYPFEPPNIHFINETSIQHPNVDKNGKVFLDILHPQNWNINIITEEIIEALFTVLEIPEVNNIKDKKALVVHQNQESKNNQKFLEDINEDEEV